MAQSFLFLKEQFYWAFVQENDRGICELIQLYFSCRFHHYFGTNIRQNLPFTKLQVSTLKLEDHPHMHIALLPKRMGRLLIRALSIKMSEGVD